MVDYAVNAAGLPLPVSIVHRQWTGGQLTLEDVLEYKDFKRFSADLGDQVHRRAGTKMTPIVYLHGFASSPKSRKAQFFGRHLEGLGYAVEIPDLAEGDFEHLTLSGQLRVIERVAAGRAVTLIGSSMGGYLAGLYASRHPEVERLVLLAPAFRIPAAFGRRPWGRIGCGNGAKRDEWPCSTMATSGSAI